MVFNVAGWIIPMAVYFVTTPLVIRGLGEAYFGLQTLVNVLVGYFSVMDMGFDLVGTKYVSEDHAKSDVDNLNKLINTNLVVCVTVGILGAIAIYCFKNIFIHNVFKIHENMVPQARIIFTLASLIFLLNMIQMWGAGILAGLQRYDIVNTLSVTTGSLSVLLGLLLIYGGYGVVGYVAAKLFISVFACIAYFPIVKKLLPKIKLSNHHS